MNQRADKKIVINEMSFKAEHLLPNYKGEYGNLCDDCVFNKDWIDFGDGVEPCRLVKCIRMHRNEGNYNVWKTDGSVRDLKSKAERHFNEHKDEIPVRYKIWGDTPQDIAQEFDADYRLVEQYCDELDDMSEDELNKLLGYDDEEE